MDRTDLYCTLNEETFSWAMFLSRLITGVALLYVTLGCLFFYRDFLYNITAMRVPFSVTVGFVLVSIELFASLFLILGWFTRIAAFVGLVGALVSSFVFFAGDMNKIFVAMDLLLLSPLLTLLLLGPGRISLDFAHAKRRVKKTFRG